ncbi:MAG: LysR family transcriptional regulator [Sandaracinus sp.]|nr:LysR family transcriptional regulator [Sandaracinus sp.]MCB9611194.1 LysR family transcriptional regulator [Sandaracinus sp.]MCB9621054.1 LysR family transcriptional regulator [Sandaracinus sp.]MCB9623719.1 LysR family transcriptional regulator [Sandaracinus sp.]MCB9630880.1 LysR family transcriptional regulator [Sandaracinus sp.]
MKELRDFDLNLLVALEALLFEGSVTGAAKRIARGQPAASHALRRLREHFGDPLLVRDGNEMRLTPRAEALRSEIEPLLREVRRVVRVESRFDALHDTRTFRVAMTDHAAVLLAGPLAAWLSSRAPRVRLHVVPLHDPEVEVARDLDVAIGYFGAAPEGLRRVTLLVERYACFVREGHPAAGAWDLDAYVAHPHVLISPRGGTRGAVDVALERIGRARDVRYLVPHYLVAPRVVASTDAILTATARLAPELSALARLSELPPPVEVADYALSMVWHERTHAEPGAKWLRAGLRDVASEVASETEPVTRR